MLEVRNLVKKYQISKKNKTKTVTALNDVSITFPETGLIFLLGKSGSGKSTLLNAIGGLDTFDSGEIIIKGKSSKNFTQSDFDSYRNTFIGFIFQEYNVLEEFTVAKNLELAIELQGKNPRKEDVDKLLEMVEMSEYAKRKPNQLSGGQKQRVAIARALIKNPEIIMADEPTGALDSNTGKQVMETLKNLSKEKLVIIVSHDREFAEIYGDRIIELKDGKIIRDVTKKEVEPIKTDSGISIIDNDVIHIKKGQRFTQNDLHQICRKIIENSEYSDTIISLSPEANKEVKKATSITDDGNREVFKDTTVEDVSRIDYSNTNLKLIKSKLKFKDSFKMGASALKNKVGKLVFTILLSFVAFAMFGIIDTISTFNRAGAVYASAKAFDSKYVSIMKESKGEYYSYTEAFKESDIKLLNEKFPDIKLKKIVNKNIRFGSYYSSGNYNYLNFNNLNTQASPSIRNVMYSGMTHITESEMSELGLVKVAGRLPEIENEICISKWQFECLKALNSEKVTDYNSLLTTYKECRVSENYFTIVGIIDDGKDMTKYKEITPEEFNSPNNSFLSMQLTRDLDFGFTNMLYISEAKYNKLLAKKINIDLGLNYSDNYSNFRINQINYGDLEEQYTKSKYPDYTLQNFNDNVYYKGTLGFDYTNGYSDLDNDEIIMCYNDLYNLTNMSENELQNAINSSTPLTIEFLNEEYNSDSGNYEYTVRSEFKVVGYIKNYYYCSLLSKHNIDNNVYGNNYRIKGNQDSRTYNYLSFFTVNDFYKNNFNYSTQYNSIEEWINNTFGNVYMKNGASLYDGTKSYELQDNEIIMYADYFSNTIGTGQELYDAIDEGLTVTVTPWGQENKVYATFTVVGVFSNQYNSTSYLMNEKTYNNIRHINEGFDYTIAVLSDNESTNKAFIEYCETFNDNEYKYTIQNGSTPILDQFGNTVEDLAEIFLYVGLFFAVFAAFLLMNFITTSISYKKREIGILRALGARGSDVFGIFFNESLVIALINFLLATIATFIVGGVLNGVIINQLGLDLVVMSVGIRQVLLILGVSVLTAFISSLLPVVKIAKKKPIDAINNR